MSKEQERALAENEYTLTAFDYQKDPVGSRDWTLFWKGWQAARAASPVSAPTKRMMVTSGGWIHEECPDCRGVCSPVIVHPDECAKYDDGARAVAPVSAEQPTPCTCCNDLAQIAAEFADASRADNEEEQLRHRQRYMGMLSRHITTGHVAAPSVASEDSATQPAEIGWDSNLKPQFEIKAKRFHLPLDIKEGKDETYVSYYTRIAYIMYQFGFHAAKREIPSEDWPRKAAEDWFGDREGPMLDGLIDDLTETIREHYAASQLSTEKKSVGLRQAPEGK